MRFKVAGGDLTHTRSEAAVRIGELAGRTGVSVRSLRYYEQAQLVLPHRTASGQRVYDEDAVARVELIQLLFRAGVPSRSVVQLLPCIYSGTVTDEMLARLLEERDRIDHQARDLAATLERLDGVIDSARTRLQHPAPPAVRAG